MNLRDHPEAEPLIKSGAAIAFQNVSFQYPGGLKVFDRFNLRLQPGQRVGLVGQSGGGKSTLFALLQRFYDVENGSITVDGQDISRVTQQSLREAISVVPQDISMFHRTILENIRYGRPTATDNEVLRAAIAARCDFVEALPDGLATMVGDRGVKLSGGQRQRIAIARAFLKDAPILLLDEATAALDSESEEAIREALGRLMRGRTVIAIAHRLATLRNFDRVVMLKDGKIIEDGPPDRLMRGSGPYRELVTPGNESSGEPRGLSAMTACSADPRRGVRSGIRRDYRTEVTKWPSKPTSSWRIAPVMEQITESPFYIPMTGQAARPRRALKHDDTFIVLDSHGDIGASAGGPDGLFNADTRYLARLELMLNQTQPLLLGSNLRDDNSALTVDLTNPDIYDGERIVLQKDLIHIVRTLFLWRGTAYQRIGVQNHGDRTASIDLTFLFDNDFADLFEVRGARRPRRGTGIEPVAQPRRCQP